MKILYNNLLNATEAKRRLEKAPPNADKTIWVEKRKGELYLKLTGFRISTTFKLKFAEEYLVLKYSGFDSYMNIILCFLWCGSFILAALIWLVLSFLTQNWERETGILLLLAGLPCFGFLWSLLLKYRIQAQKYVNKILGIDVKK